MANNTKVFGREASRELVFLFPVLSLGVTSQVCLGCRARLITVLDLFIIGPAIRVGCTFFRVSVVGMAG